RAALQQRTSIHVRVYAYSAAT
ncbi:MAG: hypothetical protein QOD41_2116, partial [Cryptosporangiaceae bacterium]|nr:hypothetical protein [Cryptosporangiaceae bacterium]